MTGWRGFLLLVGFILFLALVGCSSSRISGCDDPRAYGLAACEGA